MDQNRKTKGGQNAYQRRKRRITLEEYKDKYLQVPKIINRKPVFISEDVRDRLDEIIRRLGNRGMSVSGFVENLSRYHLAEYEKNIEIWRKL